MSIPPEDSSDSNPGVKADSVVSSLPEGRPSNVLFTGKEGIVVTNALSKNKTVFQKVYATLDNEAFRLAKLKVKGTVNIVRSTALSYSEDPVQVSDQVLGYQLTAYDSLSVDKRVTFVCEDLATYQSWEKAIKEQRNFCVRERAGTRLEADEGTDLNGSGRGSSTSEKLSRALFRRRLPSDSPILNTQDVHFHSIRKFGWLTKKTHHGWKKRLFVLSDSNLLANYEIGDLHEVTLPVSIGGVCVKCMEIDEEPRVVFNDPAPGTASEEPASLRHRLIVKPKSIYHGDIGDKSGFVIACTSQSDMFQWEMGLEQLLSNFQAKKKTRRQSMKRTLSRHQSLGALPPRTLSTGPSRPSTHQSEIGSMASEVSPNPTRHFVRFGSMKNLQRGREVSETTTNSEVDALAQELAIDLVHDADDSAENDGDGPISLADFGKQCPPMDDDDERPIIVKEVNPWIDAHTLPLYATEAQDPEFKLPPKTQPPTYGPDANTDEYYDNGLFRILVLSGGGYRGVIPCIWLSEIEEELPDFVRHIKLLAATSSGAIIGGGLALGYSAWCLRQFYELDGRGKAIFQKKGNGYLDSKYGLESKVKGFAQGFGSTTFGDLSRSLMVNAVQLSAPLRDYPGERSLRTHVFHNLKPEGDNMRVRVADALLASTAAPTYFPVYNGFIDGGLSSHNPGQIALSYALSPTYGNQSLQNIRMLHIGTGFQPQSVEIADGDPGNWGLMQWGTNLTNMMMNCPTYLTKDMCEVTLGRQRFHDINVITDIELDKTDRFVDMVTVANSRSIKPNIEWIRKHFMGA